MSDSYVVSDISKLRSVDAAVFIVAARTMSRERCVQLIKKYLPKGDIIWGIAEETHVAGFDGQPQFTTLQLADIESLVEKTNQHSPHKIYIFRYTQQDLSGLAGSISASKFVFVRGSYQYAFHMQPLYRLLKDRKQKFAFVSPFADEQEAQLYAKETAVLGLDDTRSLRTPNDFIQATFDVARSSYDHSFQIGAILASKQKDGSYTYESHAHNVVVPYETYAMHHGFAREDNKVPTNDLNHYDTVHGETQLLLSADKTEGMSLFCNVMPCRTCARAVVSCGITEVFYSLPHAGEYTEQLFRDANIQFERIKT